MRSALLIILLLFLSVNDIFSDAISIDTLKTENLQSGYKFRKGWLYIVNDNPKNSNTNLLDSTWKRLDDTHSESYLDSLFNHPPVIVWFRKHFYVDSILDHQSLALEYIIRDACEIYIDGRIIKTIGTLEFRGVKGISGFSLRSIPIPVSLGAGEHILALRYSSFSGGQDTRDLQFDVTNTLSGFEISISTLEQSIEELADTSNTFIFAFFSGIFLTLSIFHFILFIFYRENRSNLYYSLFTLILFVIFFGIYKVSNGSDLYTTTRIGLIEAAAVLSVPLLFITLLYQLFYKKILRLFWILSVAIVSGILLVLFSEQQNYGGLLILLYLLTCFIEILRIYIKAWKNKKEGTGIFLFGILAPPVGTLVLFIIAVILQNLGYENIASEIDNRIGSFLGYSMLMSVSISMTIYLAKDFSRINQKLAQQLSEIKHLFQKTISQENEKQQILESQKLELENKVQERTIELAQKNRDILDNLQYAQRIQSAIMPDTKLINQTFPESFVLYRPKDIVSGDFYSFSQKDGMAIIAAADCTGHGVTGAFLSMIGISLLNQLINHEGYTEPAQILNHLNTGIVNALKQKSDEVSDGMDIAICSFNLEQNMLHFAGANRPLYLIRNRKFEEIKPDKLAIGGFRLNTDAVFNNHQIQLSKGDSIYIFTDGFADQFGGLRGKKMLSKRLKEVLLSIADLPMQEQELKLDQFFESWKGKHEQVDDVLLIGIRA